LIELYKHFVV